MAGLPCRSRSRASDGDPLRSSGKAVPLLLVAACAGHGASHPGDADAARAPLDGGRLRDGSVEARGSSRDSGMAHDARSKGDAACPGFPVSLAALTAHNTSAYPAYDQTHFPANFGTRSIVSQEDASVAVNPADMDLSMNPVTPAHVSATDVHTLVPSRPDLRWFAHITPWFRTDGGPHIDIGLENDSAAYVQSMVTDMMSRGFDGLIVDWYGEGSYEDAVTLLVQKYVATLPSGSFHFIVMMDKGIPGLSESVLETQIDYCRKQYFGDPSYELEGGSPILMFFGVDVALGGTTMAAVKASSGAGTVWVTEGPGTLAESWVDECFDWTHDYHDGDDPSDPYNLAGVAGFLSSVSKSSKKAFGSMVAGFNGTLTKTEAWSLGKYLPRGSGACLVQGAATIDAMIPPNVTRMQWATWSDWEEGTEVESGVENDVSVTATVDGETLRWSVTSGTGDESTVDHYEVYASADGVHAADLGSAPSGVHSLDLSGASCVTSGAGLTVVAVGRPSIRDHASVAVTYSP